jgi:mannose-6-phosphate isomerase-like protein (cupin superfamily)
MKISKATAPHYHWGSECDGWFLEQAADRTVIHERMPPGTAESKHVHHVAKQFFFQLSGEATMEIEERLITLHPREGITILPGILHRIYNNSLEDIEFLVISTPSTKGDRYEPKVAP